MSTLANLAHSGSWPAGAQRMACWLRAHGLGQYVAASLAAKYDYLPLVGDMLETDVREWAGVMAMTPGDRARLMVGWRKFQQPSSSSSSSFTTTDGAQLQESGRAAADADGATATASSAEQSMLNAQAYKALDVAKGVLAAAKESRQEQAVLLAHKAVTSALHLIRYAQAAKSNRLISNQ